MRPQTKKCHILPWPGKLGFKDGLLVCERMRETEIELYGISKTQGHSEDPHGRIGIFNIFISFLILYFPFY
jgi:hypothetical protein